MGRELNMRYFGGKARISKPLAVFLNSLLEDGQPFVDAFCGSCNVVSKIDSNRVRIANDQHDYLIAMWEALQSGWQPPDHISEDDYKRIKFDTSKPQLHGFVGFGLSFSGKWWGGYCRDSRGDRPYTLQAKDSANRKMSNMKSVVFYNGSYKDLEIPNNALVYCDIPYKNTTKYSTGDFDHEEFYKWAKNTPNVVVSEYSKNVPDDATVVWTQKSKKDIRNSKGVQELTEEVVFTWDKNIIDKVCRMQEG